MVERRFPKEDESRETLLLDRAHPALRVGVQIWRPRRQGHPRDPGCVNYLLKGRTIFSIPVVDEILSGGQEAPLFHGHVARHLDHPGFIGMRCDACDMDLPAAQMDEKED